MSKYLPDGSAVGPKVLQRITGEERRAQLMDVALALFAEQGYEGTSTRDIAAAAGITEGLIFKHFPTKRELLRAVIARHAPCPEKVEHPPRRKDGACGGTLSEKAALECRIEEEPLDRALELLFSRMAEHLWENRQFIRMVIMESYRHGEAFQELVTLIEHGPDFLRRLLEQRAAAGEITLADPAVAAEMLGGAVFTLFQRHQHRGEAEWRRRSAAFIREAVRLFLNGARGSGVQAFRRSGVQAGASEPNVPALSDMTAQHKDDAPALNA